MPKSLLRFSRFRSFAFQAFSVGTSLVAMLALATASGCSETPSTTSAKGASAAKKTVASAANKSPKSKPMNPIATNGTANVHALSVQSLDGKTVPLSGYKGKAVLVVNTASECGYTPQYASLQKLYGTYKSQGLEVLAFPSNDFGEQEPGDASQIRTFVDEKYNVEFPMFAKVHATGAEKAPLYKALTEDTGDGVSGDVRWNFTKFLINPDGKVVARFESKVDPMSEDLVSAVKAVLPKS